MTPLDTKKTMESTHSRHLSLQGHLAPLLLPYVPFIPPLHTPPGHPGLLLSLQHPSQMPSSGFSFLYLYSFLFPGWPCPSCLQSSLLPSFHLCLWPKVLTPLPVYYLNSSPITLFFLSFFLFFFALLHFSSRLFYQKIYSTCLHPSGMQAPCLGGPLFTHGSIRMQTSARGQ